MNTLMKSLINTTAPSHSPLQTGFRDSTKGKMETFISFREIDQLLIQRQKKQKKKSIIFNCMSLDLINFRRQNKRIILRKLLIKYTQSNKTATLAKSY